MSHLRLIDGEERVGTRAEDVRGEDEVTPPCLQELARLHEARPSRSEKKADPKPPPQHRDRKDGPQANSWKRNVVLPWLQGLLPDNDEALRAIGRRFGAAPGNPFALLEHIGADAAGAVQILPPAELASDARAEQSARPVTEAEVARMLDQVVTEYTDGVAVGDGAGRFSIAGAQPKIALFRMPDGRWAVPEGSQPTTHILKPVVGTFRRIDVVEQLTLRAAAHLGCDVATARLGRIGDWNVLISERYDRQRTDGRWHRLHQEDMCQALSVPPSKKYQQRDGGPGVASIAQLIGSLPLVADREATGAAFFRAFVFNVVAGCTDAHAKNYSLMLRGRSVRLAPLYDLLTYAAYWDGSAIISSAMSVEGEYALDRISVAGLVRTGSRFGVPPNDASSVVDEIRSGLVEAFEAARASMADFTLAPDAVAVMDAALAGVRRLPLVRVR